MRSTKALVLVDFFHFLLKNLKKYNGFSIFKSPQQIIVTTILIQITQFENVLKLFR